MEQIKIKKILTYNKELEQVNNYAMLDHYSFEETNEGIKVIGNMNLLGEILYKDNNKEKIDQKFDVEFYVFNENIDYTLIKLSTFDLLVDGKNLIINMFFSKEIKNVNNDKNDSSDGLIDNVLETDFKNDILVEDINFDELERVINNDDTMMFSSMDELEKNDDEVVDILLEDMEENNNEIKEKIKEENIKDDNKETLFKEEYKKTYLYYRMKENDTLEHLTNTYKDNLEAILIDKNNYKKDDIICIKLK